MSWVQGEVVSHHTWSVGLYSLFVRAKIPPFVAGQFTQISLDDTHRLFRPYSFANAPDEPLLEFYYTLVNQGTFTQQLAGLNPGAPIWLAAKASGKFVLSQVPDAPDLWLMASGTGLGVFLSILKTMEPWTRFGRIILIHSVRFQEELTHRDWFLSCLSRYPGRFHYCPIVTRDAAFTGYTARITALIERGQLERDLDLSLTTSSQVMLCGNPAMIADMLSLLQDRHLMRRQNGMSKGQITIENYWKFPAKTNL